MNRRMVCGFQMTCTFLDVTIVSRTNMDMLVFQSSEKPQYLNKLAEYKSRNNNFVYRAVDIVFQLFLTMILL